MNQTNDTILKASDFINIDNCPPILTVYEAAAVLRVSERTVYSMIRANILPAIKISSRLYRISKNSLKNFLKVE